jgi:hypothetical protein
MCESLLKLLSKNNKKKFGSAVWRTRPKGGTMRQHPPNVLSGASMPSHVPQTVSDNRASICMELKMSRGSKWVGPLEFLPPGLIYALKGMPYVY